MNPNNYLFNKHLYQIAKSKYQNDNATIKKAKRRRVLRGYPFCRV